MIHAGVVLHRYPAVALELLRLRAGDAQARPLALSGATFGAGEALARGLVDEAVPAAELLMMSYGARHHIRRNALQHLQQEIPLTKKKGSFTLEESLVTLIRNGDIEREEAQVCAIHPDDLEILLKGRKAEE